MDVTVQSDRYCLAQEANKQSGYLLPDYWVLPLCDRTGVWWMDHEAYVSRVCEIVKNSGARTVLEAGCGDGWNCHKLVQSGLDVVGCDWSQNAIDHARRLVPGARFYCGDVTGLDFVRTSPDLFDAVALIEVIEHIRPDECIAALMNITRLLRPEGTFVLTTPSTNQVNHNPQHYRHFDEATIRSVIASVPGMEVIAVEGYGDAVFARKYHRMMRLFDNRLYRIKPLKRWLDDVYRHKHACRTPTDRCHGWIVTAIKRTAPLNG